MSENAASRALAAIAARDGALNCFTGVISDAASVEPGAGPLSGVPFAAKNLFDVAGITTLAGSRLYAANPPAARDATAVAALRRAGGVLVGTTNMDEFAYGFTTENPHFGVTRNPHDPQRIVGGSSGGSAAAVAAGLVPFALGSDTNGSVRVPAALCGIFGLKPTYGRISRAGVVALAPSFDHVGILAHDVALVATAFDALQGPDQRDPVCLDRDPTPTRAGLDDGIGGDVRMAVLDDHFATGGWPECFVAVDQVARALGADRRVTFPDAERAIVAALLITSSEAAGLHLDDLQNHGDFLDPVVRDRMGAGALVPAAWINHVQRFRRAYRDRVMGVLEEVDLVLAPATPFPAPGIGQTMIEIDGTEVPTRPTLGRFTAPISFIGLPALAVPVPQDGLPLGVQLIAAPHNEALILRAARLLEDKGVVTATLAA